MKIAVTAESTIDLSKDLLEKFDIKVIPYEVILDGDAKFDGDITPEEIFAFVNEKGILPKTTAINEFQYTEFFEGLKKEYDAVIHFALSSGITSSCSHAQAAAEKIPNVYIVDTQSLSTGIALLAIYARELANGGEDAETVYEKVLKRVSSVQASFVIERLDFLYKGGRCNSLQLLGANLLKLRPRIVLKDGKMQSDKKYRGSMAGVVAKYCQETLAEFNTPDLKRVFITYSSATPEMIAAAKLALSNAGFKDIYETSTGATVASHCGANTLGILYLNDGNKK